MDFVTPFVLSAALVGADYKSTINGLNRGAVEVGPIAHNNLQGAMAARFAVTASVDLVLQKRKSKKAVWIWRGINVVGTAVLVAHNQRQGRALDSR